MKHGIIRNHHGNTMEPPWNRDKNIMGSPWKHHGSTLLPRKYHGIPWHCEIAMKVPWKHHGRPAEAQREHLGIPIGSPWKLHGSTMLLWKHHAWDHHRTTMGSPWKHHGSTMEGPWNQHRSTIEAPRRPIQAPCLHGVPT